MFLIVVVKATRACAVSGFKWSAMCTSLAFFIGLLYRRFSSRPHVFFFDDSGQDGNTAGECKFQHNANKCLIPATKKTPDGTKYTYSEYLCDLGDLYISLVLLSKP